MANVHDFDVNTMKGDAKSLADYKGKTLLIVNTASKCGFTPQFKGLQALYEKFQDQGLVILGFPCNQFGSQDPGSNEEILDFCTSRFDVEFPMFDKLEVNGSGAHPLYQHLRTEAPGLLGTTGVKWNFTKFLVGPDGEVIDRFSPKTTPAELEEAIEAVLEAEVA
ncbi:MAG: glutathione peroxidase [Pseudomonadales bacterium]